MQTQRLARVKQRKRKWRFARFISPALPRWANFCRAYGAWESGKCIGLERNMASAAPVALEKE